MNIKQDNQTTTRKEPCSTKQGRKKKVQLYKPRKKKSVEEDAAIQYLTTQYDKIVPDEIKTFKDFPLSQKTLKGLKDNNYVKPTEIQRQSIGYALQGKDILGAAKTGSGKTLAFLIPILEKLFCKKWTRLDGVGAIVISPTRELAYQIYETLRKLGYLHDLSAGCIIGGQNLAFERKRMDQVNILICTPGRLLQHMDENPLFNCDNLQILVLDEADRCLDMGFAATMNAIIENLPRERQTLLFSATQTKSVKDLARLSLSFPTYVAPHEQAVTVTPDSLQQSYVICQINEKIDILWSFIKNHLKQKILVFMSTCKQVKFIYDLFCRMRPGVSLLALYGSLHQEKREKIYNEFCRMPNVVLFATDLASRGLDFPRVNWVIQMDCPEDVDTYIHRVGRTARGVFGKGEGLLMLLPHEEKLVADLQKNRIPINKILIDPNKMISTQNKIADFMDCEELKQTGQRAFVNYLKSVYLMKNKEIFNVHLIDTDAYATSLGLKVPPRIKFLHKSKKSNAPLKQENRIEENNFEDESDASKVEDLNEENKNVIEQKSKKEKPEVDFHKTSCNSGNYFFERNAKNAEIEAATEAEMMQVLLRNEIKTATKTGVGKQVLKNKIKVNSQIKFDENDDSAENDLLKHSYHKTSALDIEVAKDQFIKNDKDYDTRRFRENVKAKHKQQKRKLKGKNKEESEDKDEFESQSESDGPDLLWLPDPDKVYGKTNGNESSNNENSNMQFDDDQISDQSSGEESDDPQYKRPTKRKLVENQITAPEKESSKKVKKIQDISKSLSVEETEALAMQLLRAK